MTLQSFVPQDQDKKLAMIQELERKLGPIAASGRREQAAERCRTMSPP